MLAVILSIGAFFLFFKILDWIGDSEDKWGRKTKNEKKESIESFKIGGTVILIIIVILAFVAIMTS